MKKHKLQFKKLENLKPHCYKKPARVELTCTELSVTLVMLTFIEYSIQPHLKRHSSQAHMKKLQSQTTFRPSNRTYLGKWIRKPECSLLWCSGEVLSPHTQPSHRKPSPQSHTVTPVNILLLRFQVSFRPPWESVLFHTFFVHMWYLSKPLNMCVCAIYTHLG